MRFSRLTAAAWLVVTEAVAALAACPAAPPTVRDLDVPRFYADRAGSIVDPDNQAAQQRAVAPLLVFLRQVTADADRSLNSSVEARRSESGRCAVTWLVKWARDGALLGRMGSAQSEYQRKWDFTGAAMAYLKVKPLATTEERLAIESWLDKLATATRAFFNDQRHTRNNHWYWLGPGLAATAIATGSEKWWGEARSIMMDGARDIAADGSLPMELKRQSRALHYHGFALTPLVALAELGAHRGEDWYVFNNGALHRLVAFTARSFADPRGVEKLAGKKQEIGPFTAGAGWLPLYAARFPGKLKDALPPMQPNHRWLGGDVTLLGMALKRL